MEARFDSLRFRRRRIAVAGLVLSAGLPGAAFAEEATTAAADLGTVVFSANRTPTEAAKVGSAVTVIGRDELEKSKETYVKDVLDRVAGIDMSQAGPPGSTTSFMMRGASAYYTLVRIDGIDVSDPTGTQVAPALEHLLVGDVERIEILRGSQSALYGGTAVGGVIDITTKKAEAGGIHHSAAVEAGSYGTLYARYGLSAATDTSEMNVAVERYHTDGFSAADEKNGNTEKDGYENTTFTANASHRVSDVIRVFGALRYSRHDIQFDPSWPAIADEAAGDPRYHTEGEDVGARLGADFDLFDGRFRNTIAVQYTHIDRDIMDSGTLYRYWGERRKVEYLGNLKVNEIVGLSFGADHAHEEGNSTSIWGGSAGDIDDTGAFGQISVTPLKGVTLTGALRDDHHSMFGDHWTGRLTAAWEAIPGTKLRSSWGTGFRPPSVYELFAPYYGNAALKPETSVSFDVGVDQKFWDGRASVSATWFSLDTTDLIEYDYATWRYDQVSGTSRRQGVELSGRVQVLDWLALDAGYTYTDAQKEDGSRLGQVPRHKLTTGATLTPIEKTAFTVRGTFVDDVIDGATSRQLPDYFLLDATLSYRIDEHLEASLKARNILDRQYETVWGYGTPGASIYAGLTAKF